MLVAIMQYEVARLDENVDDVCLFDLKEMRERERKECVCNCVCVHVKAKERRSRESTDPNGMCNYYYQPPQ